MSDTIDTDARADTVGKSSLKDYLLGCVVGGGIATMLCMFPWVVPVPAHHSYPLIPTGVTSVPAYPRDMMLRFVDRKEFYDSKLTIATARVNGTTAKNLAAYTMINDNPCTIVIPLPVSFYVFPQLGKAGFADNEEADTIAHEILHCLYGSWHPRWDTILRSK
jgi:hypothetical protein